MKALKNNEGNSESIFVNCLCVFYNLYKLGTSQNISNLFFVGSLKIIMFFSLKALIYSNALADKKINILIDSSLIASRSFIFKRIIRTPVQQVKYIFYTILKSEELSYLIYLQKTKISDETSLMLNSKQVGYNMRRNILL